MKFFVAGGLLFALSMFAAAEVIRPTPANVGRCNRYIPADGPLIAHAGGGLPSGFYPNNIAALDRAAANGHTLIEIDFVQRNGGLFPGHDEPSGMSVSGLLEFLRDHPHIRIVTDMKDANQASLRLLADAAGNLQPRFIPQIFRTADYEAVRAMGYSDVILALGRDVEPDWRAWQKDKDLFAVTLPDAMWGDTDGIQHQVFYFTVNRPTKAAVYTDCLIPN